jgi:hypothetical protein
MSLKAVMLELLKPLKRRTVLAEEPGTTPPAQLLGTLHEPPALEIQVCASALRPGSIAAQTAAVAVAR